MWLQIAVVLAGSLLALVTHLMRDADSRHKAGWRISFYCVLAVSASVSIWLSVRADRISRDDRKVRAQQAVRDSIQMARMQDTVMAVRTGQIQQSLEARVQGLESKVQVSGVQLQLSDFRAAVQPLVNLAEVRYPGLETNVALRQLAADFEGIRAENARLASSVSQVSSGWMFKRLAAPLCSTAVSALRGVQLSTDTSYNIGVFVQTDAPRRQLAREVTDLLIAAGKRAHVEYRGGEPIMDTLARPLQEPVFIICAPSNIERARQAARALVCLFPDTVSVHEDPEQANNYELWVSNNWMRFDSAGVVYFKP